MIELTRKSIEKFLQENYRMSSRELFKSKYKHEKGTHNIINDVFKKFINHEIKFGLLCTTNPVTKEYEFYNYKSFHHLNSADDLLRDMKILKYKKLQILDRTKQRLSALQRLKSRGKDRGRER